MPGIELICKVDLLEDNEYLYLNTHLNYIDSVEQKFRLKIVNIFLSISLNLCFGCSKEPPQVGSFEYPQHIFWMRNKK